MFTEQDFKFIGEVFSLARMQVVNSQPNNRQALENIMNYEAVLTNKLTQVNGDTGEEVSEEANAIIATEVLSEEIQKGE